MDVKRIPEKVHLECGRCSIIGIDATHVSEIGLAKADDPQILELSRSENRVCCTLDGDFHRYLALSRMSTPSTIRIRIEGLRGPAAAELIAAIVKQFDTDLKSRVAMTVTHGSVRVRALPLGTLSDDSS